MRILVFVVILVLIFTCCTSKRRKLRKNKPIVGGVATEVGKYPYQVSVGDLTYSSSYDRDDDDSTSKNETELQADHFCGGSIISVDWVLCAAHCLTGYRSDDLAVRVGSVKYNKEGHVHEVEKIIIHPDYNKGYCDISLIKVKVPFEIGPNVQPIPLNKNPIRPGNIVTVTGWGNTGEYYNPEILQKVEVPVVPQWECEWLYGKHKLSGSDFCAGRAGRDSCQGDSGGPVMYDGYLIGVVSWGEGCALPGFPGVYTDVQKFRDWIRKNSGV